MEYVLIVHAMVLEILSERDVEDARSTSGSQGAAGGWAHVADADTPLAYPKARELLILIARMTGYDGDEIEDYLRDSFENPVWPWGYADYLLA